MRAFKARRRSSRRKSNLSRQISPENLGEANSIEDTDSVGNKALANKIGRTSIGASISPRDKTNKNATDCSTDCSDSSGFEYSSEPDNLVNSMPKRVLERLMDFTLFRNAPHTFFIEIARKLTLMTYHTQDHIVKAGESAKAMYWILRGCVNVTSPDGETVHAQLLEGSYFGEIGILFNRSRTATIVAKTKVLVGVLTADNFNQILPNFPQVERQIRDEAQERLAMQDKKKRSGVTSLLTANIAWNSGNVQHTASSSKDIKRPVTPESTLQFSSHLISTEVVDDSISIRQFLKSLPLFTTLPAEIAHRIALCVEIEQAKPYEYIFHSGDRGTNIYFIVSGEVEVLTREAQTTSSNGCVKRSEKLLARLGPGQYFGEMGFLGSISDDSAKSIRSADVRSVSSSTLLVLTGETLKHFCESYPIVKREIIKTADDRANRNLTSKRKENSAARTYSGSKLVPDPHNPKKKRPKRDFTSKNYVVADASPSIATGDSNSSTFATPSSFPLNPKFKFGTQEEVQSSSMSHQIDPSPTKLTLEDSAAQIAHPKTSKIVPSRSVSPATGPTQLLELNSPPMNAAVSSGDSFKIQHPAPLNYMSHRKRTRLLNLGGGPKRRKNSVLSVGPLPDRLLLRCFHFLQLPDLMKLRLVCRRWRQLLYVAPGLFDTLDLTPWNNSINDDALIEITNFVGSRPKLIDLSSCFHVTDEGFSYMINEIAIEGQIRVIKMRSCWEISAMAIMDIGAPHIGKCVEEIDLTNCRKVKDDVIQRLLGTNDSRRTLAAVFPTSTNDQNNWIYPLDEPVAGMEMFDGGNKTSLNVGCPNLKILTLRHCKSLTDSTLRHIALYARHNLKQLDLTRCTGITDVGFLYWGYESFANLEKLVLSECIFLTDDSIRSIANCTGRLRELYLSFCCSLTDASLETLCLGCPNLEVLDLSFCGRAVSDVSLLGISMHLRKLQRIILKGCQRVTRSGLDSLLGGFTSLTYIDISQCKNAHMYQGGIEATKFEPVGKSKSVFLKTEENKERCVEVVI
ncbi:LAME_0E09142g1_1 [Lachancea meyersii CBS 8951]|uniref:LAME_0E09142g1_1 n=1 Tax=Lachancea meyersii CBS 8951 TaxID=1266667 RepID=A0A1G4JJH6_9SACH|nr:LAME_0E09142g1_1 [Lachancea meyersii CBS 8951]